MTPPDGTDGKTPAGMFEQISSTPDTDAVVMRAGEFHPNAMVVGAMHMAQKERELAQTAAQLAECRERHNWTRDDRDELIGDLRSQLTAALADNASLRAGIEQVQIHQGHLQEELTAALAERAADREVIRECVEGMRIEHMSCPSCGMAYLGYDLLASENEHHIECGLLPYIPGAGVNPHSTPAARQSPGAAKEGEKG